MIQEQRGRQATTPHTIWCHGYVVACVALIAVVAVVAWELVYHVIVAPCLPVRGRTQTGVQRHGLAQIRVLLPDQRGLLLNPKQRGRQAPTLRMSCCYLV